MALIKCPECGGDVSSNADTCVHCGCKYSYCPECGAIYIGMIEKCSACGYRISAPAASKAEPSVRSTDDLSKALEKRAPTDKIVARCFTVAAVLSGILMFGFLAGVFAVILTFDKNSLASFLKVEKVHSQIKGLSIAFGVFFALLVVAVYCRELYFQVGFAKWLAKFKIDGAKYLRKNGARIQASFMPEGNGINDMAAPVYLTVVPHDASVKIIKAAVCSLAGIGSAIALVYFLMQNAESLFLYIISGLPFEFSYVPLIVAVAFLAVNVIARCVCDAIFNKRKDGWLKSINL